MMPEGTIFRVRTRSGKEHLTKHGDPFESLHARGGWTSVKIADLRTGNMVVIKGDAIESVEIVTEDQIKDEGQ